MFGRASRKISRSSWLFHINDCIQAFRVNIHWDAGFYRMLIAFKLQAAFDPRVLASVCFFATDIHSATLGKGKTDDTLARVRQGDLTGKAELVVSKQL